MTPLLYMIKDIIIYRRGAAMNIAELTTASLRLLHDAVIQAVKVDDETPPGQPQTS